MVLGCTVDADCNDRIDCTTNRCVGGGCVYTANDAACGVAERCLERAGCCVDADSDTFTATACGGSDCDDDDFAVRPGALEICGAGDRNCNGQHRAALSRSVVQVTSTPYSKTQLGVGTERCAA